MDGDGVELIHYNDFEAVFDVDNDGFEENTGWVSGDDAILVHDKNEDGVINDITETISEYYTDGVSDGLEALKTLTLNNYNAFNVIVKKCFWAWQSKKLQIQGFRTPSNEVYKDILRSYEV